MGFVDIVLIIIVLTIACLIFYKSFIKKSGSCGHCHMSGSCKKKSCIAEKINFID